MTRIAIVGCGVVGAAIAYELSRYPDLDIVLLDRQPPAQAATGAALGVLMGAISHKTKGRAWAMREESLFRYETLIPELEAQTGRSILFNQQGILMLLSPEANLEKWHQLIEVRKEQGWGLEFWDGDRLQTACPQVNVESLQGAIYSPGDRQLDPTALTLALVAAAEANGVTVNLSTEVKRFGRNPMPGRYARALQLSSGMLETDWVVIAAGLGSTQLTQSSQQPVDIRPVLGQALRVRLSEPMGDRQFQPVISGNDIHIVPLGNGEYRVGATVEFPADSGEVTADPQQLETVWQGAIAHCPALKNAEICDTWFGLRPRPYQRPAPIIEPLEGYGNVMLATGHYRNGVLLAPATARIVCEHILDSA